MSELVLFSPPADEPLTIVDIVNGLGLAVDDPKIPDLIRTARQSLEGEEGWLGRALITQTWDLYLDAFPCEIVLPFPPLQAVTEIAVADSDGVEAILPRTSYRVLKGAIGRIVATRSWPWVGAREQGVRVRFVCGYGDGGEDVPAPIRSALVLMVGRLMSVNRADMAIRTRAVEGVGSTTWMNPSDVRDGITATEDALLMPYRIWS